MAQQYHFLLARALHASTEISWFDKGIPGKETPESPKGVLNG